ncbi:MAG: TlpA family protein disulfide reductase [Chloroflexi bacterium]|nr:TlpA family protein disulfide reductase [Chloroflexota bacterium]
MRLPKTVTILAIAVFALIVGYSFTVQDLDKLGSNPAGKTAPNFKIATFDGGEVSREALLGKPVVVNFWASWCPPCREEAPTLEKIWRQYRDKGVVFVGVAWRDNDQDSLAFIKEFGVTYPNGPDVGGKIGSAYGITGVPESFFITREGKVTRKFLGAISERQLTSFIEEILR